MTNVRFFCATIQGILTVVLLLHCAGADAGAQPWGVDIPERPGYEYDDRFYIGYLGSGANTGFLQLLYERLRADFTFTYSGPTQERLDVLRNPALWRSDPEGRYVDSTQAAFWVNRGIWPVKAIYAPGAAFEGGNVAYATENIYDPYSVDIVNHFTLDKPNGISDSLVDFRTQFMHAGRYDPCGSPPCDSVIAGFPKFTSLGFENNKGANAAAWYATIGQSAAYADSFDVSFMIRTDTTIDEFEALGSGDTLAYAVLYRRDTTAQVWNNPALPRCALFAPFQTVAITKGMYLDLSDSMTHTRNDRLQDNIDFRELYFRIRFPTAPVTLDTAFVSIPPDTTWTYTVSQRIDSIIKTIDPPDTTWTYDTTEVHDTTFTVDGPWNIGWGGQWHPYVPSKYWQGWGASSSVRYCDLLDSILVEHGVLPEGSFTYDEAGPEGSDFLWIFHTTGRVQLDFLGGRNAPHTYRLLQSGAFDDFITASLDVLDDPMMDTTLLRVGASDELKIWTSGANAMTNSVVAHHLLQSEPSRSRAGFSNPINQYSTIRARLGDLDSTDYKPVQMMAAQAYQFRKAIPMFYANPDSMSWDATRDYYDMTIPDRFDPVRNSAGVIIGWELVRDRYIMGPSNPDYLYYLGHTQKILGDVVNKYVGHAEISRSLFSQFENAIPYPVLGVIQTQGWLAKHDGYNGYDKSEGFGNHWRPVTPEEISVQCWLALHGGLDGGIIFGDYSFEGSNIGILNGFTLDTLSVYDTLSWHPRPVSKDDPKWQLPKMWLGFRERYGMVRRIVDEFKENILPVYTTLDLYNGINICVHGEPDWDEIPMLASVRAERAVANNDTANVSTGVFDTADSTYLEAAIFAPTLRDTAGFGVNARYLLLTNRRTWPVDTLSYSLSARDLLDSLAIFDTTAYEDYTADGFGRIDVRRPWIVLKNSSSTLADSLIIEKVGHEGEWSGRYAYGDTIAMEWLDPGWGCMYRIIPVNAYLSELGTAFNNAVHSENPAYDTLGRDRLVVYERDSAVYIRTVDSTGSWSGEMLLSDATDTAVANGKRIASNFLPSIAVCRNDTGLTRVVWERRDSAGLHSVESILLTNDNITTQNLEQTVSNYFYRNTLLSPVPLNGPEHLAPSVAGIYDPAGIHGFVVAWAGPDTGITVMAIREWPLGGHVLATHDTSSIRRIHSIDPVDSLCRYPTLAHVPRYELIDINTGQTAGTPAEEKEPGIQTTEELRWYNRVHLAYQQGDANEAAGQRIYYHAVGAIFPPRTSGPEKRPGLFVGTAEEVTKKIDACSFVHPSIAADSTRIGVTFEIVEAAGGQRNIGLRFRDTLSFTQTPKDWESTLYRWGGPLKKVGTFLQTGSLYARPSLTEFPARDSLTLSLSPQGGLCWYWVDGPDGRAHPQWLYRYGWFSPRQIGDGKHPTMTLVSQRTENPFEATSVFHRAEDSLRVSGTNRMGESVYRYGAHLLNTPGNPIGYFATAPGGAGIVAGATLIGYPQDCYRSRSMDFGFVFSHSSISHPDDDLHGPGDPSVLPPVPGLPPGFFAPPGNGTTLLDTLDQTDRVVRTSLFTAGTEPVYLRRIAAGGDSLSEWLDNYGMDPLRSVPADIWIVTELVRASDTTVLWRSDTLSARGLDTLSDPLDEYLMVPVHTATDSGTIVYIRMTGFATLGVPYDMHGGFSFHTSDSTGGGFLKMRRVRETETQTGYVDNQSVLSVSVVPNPASDRATIHLRMKGPGHVELAVYSSHGEHLADLPSLESAETGEYLTEISLAGVPPGVYILRASCNGIPFSTPFSVVR